MLLLILLFQSASESIKNDEEDVVPEQDNNATPDIPEPSETPTASPKEDTTSMLFIGNDDNVKQKNVFVNTENLVRKSFFFVQISALYLARLNNINSRYLQLTSHFSF